MIVLIVAVPVAVSVTSTTIGGVVNSISIVLAFCLDIHCCCDDVPFGHDAYHPCFRDIVHQEAAVIMGHLWPVHHHRTQVPCRCVMDSKLSILMLQASYAKRL